jgi:hypothetical protein
VVSAYFRPIANGRVVRGLKAGDGLIRSSEPASQGGKFVADAFELPVLMMNSISFADANMR